MNHLPAHERWVIYSTFSASGSAAAYVVEQLEQYIAIGFKILIVDTSARISDERAADWTRLSPDWFQRPNVGYDFASFRAGLDLLTETRGLSSHAFDLIVTNDSCFGPFFPLQRVLDRFDATDNKAVFGITDSHEIAYHLQSYWLFFRADVCPLAHEFFGQMAAAGDREEAIKYGEIGLSRFLLHRGCSLHAYVRTEDIVRFCSGALPRPLSLVELGVRRVLKRYKYTRRGDGACLKFLLGKKGACAYINPTLDFAPALLVKQFSPFVKRALLRSNPFGDRAVPAGIDVEGLLNADAAQILRTGRRVIATR